MLNKITTISYIKTNPEKDTTEKGVVYHKIFCTSKAPSGEGYIPYSFTLWGSRFDGVMQHLLKDKPIYVEADLQEPKPYTNTKGETKVVLQGYVTKIEFLPREKSESAPVQEVPTEGIEQTLPF